MSKNERTHGDEMSTIGELHSLYKVKIMINKMINKLEVAYETDKKGRERKGKPRDYIAEWFKWVEKVGKYLRKHILH